MVNEDVCQLGSGTCKTAVSTHVIQGVSETEYVGKHYADVICVMVPGIIGNSTV